MTRNLNSRQMKFADLVANGRTLVGAYRLVYEPGDPKALHVYRNARRLSRHPVVAAKIREFQQQLFPALEDAEAIQNHACGVAYHLSMNASSERVRLRAAEMLFELSEKLQAARGATPGQEGRALTELRRLYRRMTALGDKEKPVAIRAE
jgi:hypothetical protein